MHYDKVVSNRPHSWSAKNDSDDQTVANKTQEENWRVCYSKQSIVRVFFFIAIIRLWSANLLGDLQARQ